MSSIGLLVTFYTLGSHEDHSVGRLLIDGGNMARVAERVRQGGHHIDAAVIRRRFEAGRRNLEQAYKPAVDSWAEYDNVGEEPTLLQWGENP